MRCDEEEFRNGGVMKRPFLLVLMMLWGVISCWQAVSAQQLTYGSIVRFKHVMTGNYLSQLNVNYTHIGSSLQYALTCVASGALSPTAMQWQILGQKLSGTPINNGDIVILASVAYGYFVSSKADVVSPATWQQEVFSQQAADNNSTWYFYYGDPAQGAPANGVFLIHVATKGSDIDWRLHSHAYTYNLGGYLYQEVTAFPERDANDWFSYELVSQGFLSLTNISTGGAGIGLVEPVPGTPVAYTVSSISAGGVSITLPENVPAGQPPVQTTPVSAPAPTVTTAPTTGPAPMLPQPSQTTPTQTPSTSTGPVSPSVQETPTTSVKEPIKKPATRTQRAAEIAKFKQAQRLREEYLERAASGQKKPVISKSALLKNKVAQIKMQK